MFAKNGVQIKLRNEPNYCLQNLQNAQNLRNNPVGN